MEENFILNDSTEKERKLGRKERKEIEKRKKQKEKKKEIEAKKNENKIKKEEEDKKKEEISGKNKKSQKIENKIPKIFTKSIKSKKIRQKKYEEESSEENSKIDTLNSSKNGLDIINDNTQKSKKPRSKEHNRNENFENNIIKTYEKLSLFHKNNKRKNENLYEPQLTPPLKLCEKKLRNALDILKNDKNIVLNRNIIDKLSRLTEHDQINLNYIIGNIYMILMKRGNIFDYSDENFENNDLVFFTNKVIQLKDILINTRIGIFYKKCLIKYLNYIKNEFKFEINQLNIINQVLEANKDLEHKLLLQKDFDDLVYSISENLIKQNNFYEQYNVLIKNKKLIIDTIKKINIKNKRNYCRYLEFGRTLTYLFFNKSFRIYFSDQNGDDNGIYEKNELFGFTKIFFDGHENKGEIKMINSENYLIDYDDEIDELREKICDIIIAFANKFIHLNDDFSIQYIIYTLVKRIFFSGYKSFENISKNLLVKCLINLCFFEESVELANYFINKIMKSKEEDQNLKNLLIKQLDEVKNKNGFLFNYQKSIGIEDKLHKKVEEEQLDIKEGDEKKEEDIIKKAEEEETEESQKESEYEDDENEDDENDEIQKYYKINSEILFIIESDLKIGFFNIQNIKQGEKFIFYEEINNSYGILDFCMYIQELDINLNIIDLTEGKLIFQKKRIDQLIHCPFKLIMFFNNPRILKFEIDNSFSWFTSKTIKYKTNIFYPCNPYLIGTRIILNNYKNDILKEEKSKNKKIKKEERIEIKNDIENLLIMKIDGENKVFNCNNVQNNLKKIKNMRKNQELNISSIFIEIGNNQNKEEISHNFYYNDKENGFVKNKLDKETFEDYISNYITKSNSSNLYIINLYIINGDLEENENNIITIYDKYKIKQILGFEPLIKKEGIIQKILYFVQNLNQAQILYYLYKQKINNNQFEKVFLLNYTKDCGYQTALFNNGEITLNHHEFSRIKKSKSIEDNIDLIINGIKTINNDEKNINIILTKSVDENEMSITPKKYEEVLVEKIENKNNIKIDKLDSDFNEEIEINSHIFYLDN